MNFENKNRVFDFQSAVKDTVEEIYNLSLKITDVFSSDFNLVGNSVSTLKALYSKRKELVSELNQMLESSEGKEFINKREPWWLESLNKIKLHEDFHLEKLDNKVKLLGSELKNIQKKKQVLLYMKKQK
jgi:hypothetical protein